MRALSWKLPDVIGGYPLPTGAQFSAQHQTLDPAIFTSTEQMRPEVRDWCLDQVNNFWQPRYGNWWDWAKVYLAGSTASYWYSGDNDFDLLVGVSSSRFARAHPEMADLARDQHTLCDHFNAEFKEGFNSEAVDVPGHDEPYSITLYANPGSYDIRSIKPYAAYSISDDKWAVHPSKLPRGFSAKSMPRSFWESVAKMAGHIKDVVAEGPEGAERQAELLEELHHGRQLAYSGVGSGVFDQRQILWLALERLGVLQDLIAAVHPDSVGHPKPLVP